MGNVIATTDGNGNTTQTVYNADNEPTATRDGLGNWSHVQYDADGNVVSSTDASGNSTTYQYQVGNFLTHSWDPNGSHTALTYTALGQVASTTDGNNHVTSDYYDQAGQLSAEMLANGALTQYSYTADGQMSSETDPDGNVTRYAYDPAGNQAEVVTPTGGRTLYEFDANQELIQSSDADGRKKVLSYNGEGQLTSELWYNADGSLADTRTFAYDAAGNLTSASNAYGTYTFTYDDANRLLTQTDPWNLTLAYQYDGAGNVSSVQDSLGGVAASSYNADDQLKSRTLSGTGVIPLRFDFTYTADGQVQTLARYKDLAGTQKVSTSTFSYDPAGNLTDVKHTNAGGSTLSDYSYAYDLADQLISEWDNGTQANYSYDKAGQVLSAGGSSYSYDPSGNRTLPGYQTGKGNELLADGTWNYTYDAAGNVVTKPNIANGNVWTYTYDLNNQLKGRGERQPRHPHHPDHARLRRVRPADRRGHVHREHRPDGGPALCVRRRGELLGGPRRQRQLGGPPRLRRHQRPNAGHRPRDRQLCCVVPDRPSRLRPRHPGQRHGRDHRSPGLRRLRQRHQ